MSLQRIDVVTRKTVAGIVRLMRRAAELVLDIDGVGSPRQVLASCIDIAADETRNLLPDAISIEGLCRSGMNPKPTSYALPSSRGGASTLQRRAGPHRTRTRVADLVWEANTVSAADQRTVGELLADSDALARAELESQADLRADPEPAALQAGWTFALREPARPQKRLQMSAVLRCYPPALSSNTPSGSGLDGRRNHQPEGR